MGRGPRGWRGSDTEVTLPLRTPSGDIRGGDLPGTVSEWYGEWWAGCICPDDAALVSAGRKKSLNPNCRSS